MEACREGGKSQEGTEVTGVVAQTLTQRGVRTKNNTLSPHCCHQPQAGRTGEREPCNQRRIALGKQEEIKKDVAYAPVQGNGACRHRFYIKGNTARNGTLSQEVCSVIQDRFDLKQVSVHVGIK